MLCLLLAALVLGTTLAACGGDTPATPDNSTDNPTDNKTPSTSTDTKDNTNTNSSSGYQTVAEKTGYGYVASYQSLNIKGLNYAYDLRRNSDGRLMMRGNYVDEETGEYMDKYFSMAPDGTDVQEIPMPQLAKNEYVQSICDAGDGFWLFTVEWVSNGNTDDGGVAFDSAAAVIGGADGETVVATTKETNSVEPDASTGDWTTSTEDQNDWTGGDTTPTDKPTTEEPADDGPWIDIDDGNATPAEPMESYNLYHLKRVDKAGNVISELDLSDLTSGSDYFYVNTMVTDNAGSLYLVCDTMIYQIKESGEKTGELEFPNWVSNAYSMGDGRILVGYYGDNGYEMSWLKTDTMELGDTFELPGNANSGYNIVFGGGSYDLYLDDQNVLYGYKAETGEMTPLLNWMDSDLNTYSMNGYCVVDETNIRFLFSEDGGEVEFGTLTRVPYSELPVRQTITIGGQYLNYNIRNLVSKFNRTNENYRISFIDYSQYNSDDNPSAAQERLDMDMANGNGPDILLNNSLGNYTTYVAKGFLADLYTLMGDTKDQLVLGYRNATEINGGLYMLCSSFAVSGLWTNADYVGDDGEMSLDELLAACDALGEDGMISAYTTRDSVLSMILATSYNDLINMETGECNFDSPDFVKLLEYVNRFPAEIDYDNYNFDYSSVGDLIRAKQLIFSDCYIYGFSDINYSLVDMGGMDGLAMVGEPGLGGGKFIVQANNGLAINARSKYQDVCWEFVSMMLSDEYQERYSYQLSVLQSRLDEQAQDATKPPYYLDENGEKVEYEQTYYTNDGQEVKIEPLTQEQVDYFMNIINGVDGSYQYDEELVTVVSEEAAAYFAGQKSAEEVAKLIQSRVQIYINEQR